MDSLPVERLTIFKSEQAEFSRACILCRGSRFLNVYQEVPLIACEQCDRRAHNSCLDNVGIQEDPRRGWFCTKRCASLNFWLRELLNNPIELNTTVGHGDYLTWTLLDNMQEAKIQETIGVLGMVFSDEVARKVVYGLNPYRGFYTAIVESNGMVVSVATFRVHRDIAEVAFVTTVASRRRKGICGILMKELENRLKPIGVDQIFLHSTSKAIHSWTTTFGYERMPIDHNYKEYNLLQFKDTIMCSKCF